MNTLNRVGIALFVATMAACGRAPEPSAGQPAAAPAAPARQTTCERVSAEQMSAILGAAVNAEATSNTECSYTPKDGSGVPMAQLTVDLGSAEAAMTASGMLGQMEPGMTNPYEGMGDQAAAIGPAVWVRRGEDLIMITVIGVADHDLAVRRVYAVVDKGF